PLFRSYAAVPGDADRWRRRQRQASYRGDCYRIRLSRRGAARPLPRHAYPYAFLPSMKMIILTDGDGAVCLLASICVRCACLLAQRVQWVRCANRIMPGAGMMRLGADDLLRDAACG